MNRLARVSCVVGLLLPAALYAQPLGPAPASDADRPASVRPPAPPIPEPPADPLPASRPDPVSAANVRPPQRLVPASEDDPFQQVPRDRVATSDELSRAASAFAAKRYVQAAALFGEADRHKARLTDADREQWAYCRLHGVALQLNGGKEAAGGLASLKREVESAMEGGSARLRPFGNELLAEIGRRGPGAATPATDAGWQVVESGSFRVLHRGQVEQASDVSRTAESARKAMYERWAGPAGADWSPRCDIYLYPTGAEYARATGKPADRSGHSTVGSRAGRVATRRIDLRADEPTLLDAVLPSEVTQVLLADLFADQPLPRWALVGMAALAETPESVARYHRAVPGLLREKKLFAVGAFIERADFPDATSVTPFYAESVSLVSYLVELRGPKALTAFLREAPRRGYAKALTTHYGFKDAADLQDRWVKHELGGQ